MQQSISCNKQPPARGEFVKLVEQPDGCMSRFAPVTVGKDYQVLDLMGSNLVVSTDVPGETASLWRGRFERTAH